MKRTKLCEVLIQIRTKRGKLTPAVVVSEASDPKHPLHKRFDWNDASAARKQRLEVAADLIRRVTIKVVTKEGPVRVRQWHAVRAAGVVDAPEGYVPNEDVVARPEYRQAMLRQMERDWEAMVGRYEHLKEFWSMVARSSRGRRHKKAS